MMQDFIEPTMQQLITHGCSVVDAARRGDAIEMYSTNVWVEVEPQWATNRKYRAKSNQSIQSTEITGDDALLLRKALAIKHLSLRTFNGLHGVKLHAILTELDLISAIELLEFDTILFNDYPATKESAKKELIESSEIWRSTVDAISVSAEFNQSSFDVKFVVDDKLTRRMTSTMFTIQLKNCSYSKISMLRALIETQYTRMLSNLVDEYEAQRLAKVADKISQQILGYV